MNYAQACEVGFADEAPPAFRVRTLALQLVSFWTTREVCRPMLQAFGPSWGTGHIRLQCAVCLSPSSPVT